MKNLTVDPNRNIPLYLQVKDVLVDRIQSHVWDADQLIPTEQELMDEFQVSRTTIRQAISMLVQDGLLDRRQGRGTIVKSQPFIGSIGRLRGFAEEVLEKGGVPQSHLLRAEFSEQLFYEKSMLQVPPEARVLLIERIRFADSLPIAIERSCWPEHIGNILMQHDLNEAKFYEILEENSFPLKRANESISALICTTYESDLLGIRAGEALLEMSRLSFGFNDKPIEFTKTRYRSDQYHYDIELIR